MRSLLLTILLVGSSCISWLEPLTVNGSADQTVATKPMKPVTLAATKERYILGEPVLLTVSVTNTEDAPLSLPQAFSGAEEPEIPVYINGQRWMWGYVNVNVVRNQVHLPPSSSWSYDVIVCDGYFEFERKQRPLRRHLAFEKPGVYKVRAGHDRTPLLRHTLESNTIELRIEEPKREDATVWEQLQQIDWGFYALQWYEGPSTEVAKKFMRLLSDYPKTGYRPALRASLRRSYFHRRHELDPETMAKVRNILAIKSAKELEDARLDARFKANSATALKVAELSLEFTVGELLKQMSDQCDVPFDAEAKLKSRILNINPFHPGGIRGHMELLSNSLEAFWEKTDKGYRLTQD